MAASTNSTPLLTKNASDQNQNPNNISTNEDIVEPYLRDLTWTQVWQIILSASAAIFMAQQTFISIFTETKPTWHSTNPGEILSNDAISSICQLPLDAWSWDKPAYTSIISEWSLECVGNPIIAGLPSSSFFVGCLFGGALLFFIGDSFGRKRMLVLSCLVMCVASFATAFASNVWIYSALRFITGAGRAASGSCGLVLAKEIVGKKWQGKVVTTVFLVFTVGFMLLPVEAYFTQNYSWRVLYLLTSVPALLYCLLLHFCAYESPRWLLTQGRKEEAIAVLRSISSTEIKGLSWDFTAAIVNQDQKAKVNCKLAFFKVLMEEKEILKQLILCMIISSGIGIVYYGMSLGVSNMDFNLYTNVILNALLQIPSNVLILLTVSRWKRRTSLFGLSAIAGVCCILLCFTIGESKDHQIFLELASFFCACTGFILLLIYSAELFPTHIRNSAVAMVWLALTLGGAISPVLIAAGGDNKFLSYGVFGVLIMVTGSLLIFLPETLGSMTRCENVAQVKKPESLV